MSRGNALQTGRPRDFLFLTVMKKLLLIALLALVAIPALQASSYNEQTCSRVISDLGNGRKASSSVYNQAFDQAFAVVTLFEGAVNKIKRVSSKDKREEMADSYNTIYADEYRSYSRILKLLRQHQKAGYLPASYRSKLSELMRRGSYIESMFTKFRSGYDL